MLQDKLDQASRKATKARLVLLVVIAAVGLAIGLVVFKHDALETLARALISAEPDQQTAEGEAATVLRPIAKEAYSKTNTEKSPLNDPSVALPEPGREDRKESAGSSPQPSAIPFENTQDREAYKELLRRFQDGPEQIVQSAPYRAWHPERQQDIVFLKEKSFEAFEVSDYATARSQLQTVLEMANAEVTAMDLAYRHALSAAEKAKLAGDYDAAMTSIDQALALFPDATEAQKLKPLIEVMPAVQKLLKSADRARTENNLSEEYEFLRKARTLDPSLSGIKEREAELAIAIKEQKYFGHIKAGLSHVEERKLEKAQVQYESARKIDAKREETTLLGEKITRLKRALDTEHFMAEAKIAANADDWQKSFEFYSNALKIQPNNQSAGNGVTLAQSLIGLNKQISSHLRNPHRLASSNVAEDAHRVIADAKEYRGKSPSLDLDVETLSQTLRDYNVDVAVVVSSDEQTKVSVRGVGQVGVIREKVIKLKPGTYTFEGKRSGFKSKLVRVEIPPGSTSFKVSVVSDERI